MKMEGLTQDLIGRALPRRPSPPGLVVVTGAAGFIGSTLCEALLAAGWRVRGVDALTTTYAREQKRANLASLVCHDGFEFVEADLTVADMPTVLDSADAVAHLAGEPGVSTSWGTGFERYVERNVLSTQRILERAAAQGVARFVYASSSSVYGSASGPMPENTIPCPASPYGITKLAAEHLTTVYAGRGLSAVSLRYFSVYGPRQRPDMALHRFIEAALDNRPITIFGDGTQARDMTYVDDVVAATMAALTAAVTPGTVLNVPGGHPIAMCDVVALLRDLLGVAALRVRHEGRRAGDVERTEGLAAAARAALGWEPRIGIAEGVRRQIEWHLARRATRAIGTARRPLDGAVHNGLRMLIYTQDGRGLGHLRRASSLAAAFMQRTPGASVLTVSDSPVGTMLRDHPHHDYLKLPSIVKAGPSDWHSLCLPLAFAEVIEMRGRLILEAASTFRPDVFLIDHMPHGAMGELLPTLEALRDTPTRIVLGVRDIVDAPDVVQHRWRAEGALDALERYYDRVLVFGSRDVFDLPREYEWPARLADLVEFCGYVCTPDSFDDARRVRARRLGALAGGRMIVAMAGGGADAHPLMSTLLEALPDISAAQPCVLELVTGPFMPDEDRRDLKRRAEGLPVRMRTMVRDPLSYAAAADLVVGMAGYNTTMEVLRVGTPALLVPRRGPSSEQRMRARRFADLGWVRQLDPDELTPSRLTSAVLEALCAGRPAQRLTPPDLSGLTRSVDHLLAAAIAARTAHHREVASPSMLSSAAGGAA